MANRDGPTKRRWVSVGCTIVGAAVGIAAVIGVVLVAVALRQTGSEQRRSTRVEHPLPDAAGMTGSVARRGRVEIDVSVAQLTVTPAAEGESLALDARYDDRRYRLEEDFEQRPDGGWVYRVRFVPLGSSMMALLRVKLGQAPPALRLTLPRDVRLELVGAVERGFTAIELGGLSVETTDLDVADGAVNLSFAEPLAEPMQSLTIRGSKGAVEVTGLGNASPARTSIEQHLGALDLDLRGAWVRDGDIDIDARFAGGSVWLPHDVPVDGIEHSLEVVPRPSETPRPRLHLDLGGHAQRLIVVE